MDPQDNPKIDGSQVADAILHHIEQGLAADWALRCDNFVYALELLKLHSLSETTTAISKHHRQHLSQQFRRMCECLLVIAPGRGDMDVPRMHDATAYLVRFWSQPRSLHMPVKAEGAVLHALILTSMLEMSLRVFALSIQDRFITVSLRKDRTALLHGFLDTTGCDAKTLGEG